MNTFMAYPSFKESARCLDRQRLGKQRLEAKEIIDILQGKDSGWKHHPVVGLWKGYLHALIEYYNTILAEWERRGYKNIKMKKILIYDDIIEYPPWLGRKDFHDAHKSNLLRKNPEHYSQFGWKVRKNLPYLWK